MWRIKVLIQFALALLPYGERVNFQLQRARGAYTSDALLRDFLTHAAHVQRLNERYPLAGLTVMEIGTGWTGMGSIVLALFGVDRIHSYDHVKHLRYEIMRRLIDAISANLSKAAEVCRLEEGIMSTRIANMHAQPDLDSLLDCLCVDLYAPADARTTGLPDRSVDLVYSYGVLEHVSPAVLEGINLESKRILKPTGRAFHNVGMHDHYHSVVGLGNGVNFLKYPEWLWRFFVDNQIAYHNRLRLPDYLRAFAESDAQVIWSDVELLDRSLAAVAHMKVNDRFRDMSQEELAATHLYVDLAWP